MPQPSSPDVILLGAEWQPRALIRAQLIEEGFDVVATETWPATRRHLRPGSKPRFVIADLKGLPNPRAVLKDLRVLMVPGRVLVLTAVGTVPAAEIESLGFRMLSRPISIKEVVRMVTEVIRSNDPLTRK
jgi:hypothetical protein